MLVLMGSLEVRRKCRESAWHVVSQGSRVEGACIRTQAGGGHEMALSGCSVPVTRIFISC